MCCWQVKQTTADNCCPHWRSVATERLDNSEWEWGASFNMCDSKTAAVCRPREQHMFPSHVAKWSAAAQQAWRAVPWLEQSPSLLSSPLLYYLSSISSLLSCSQTVGSTCIHVLLLWELRTWCGPFDPVRLLWFWPWRLMRNFWFVPQQKWLPELSLSCACWWKCDADCVSCFQHIQEVVAKVQPSGTGWGSGGVRSVCVLSVKCWNCCVSAVYRKFFFLCPHQWWCLWMHLQLW